MRFWLDRGVDGFRVDVAHKMARDPELRDNPLVELDPDDLGEGGEARARRKTKLKSVPRNDEDWPEVHEILRRFRRTLDAYSDRMAVGEVWLLNLVRLARYYGSGQDEFHLAHNFVFLMQPWKAEAFRSVVDQFLGLLPADAWPAWMLGDHDVPRIACRYDEGENGQARARVAAMMLLTLRGTPFVYMGDEIGMTDGEVPPDRVVDVDGRDPERTPVPWDGSPGAGFSTGEPWLPIGADAATVNVAAQRDDPTSMLGLYRRLIWYRKGSPALQAGEYRSLPDAPDGLYAYLRTDGDVRLLVALNFSGRPVELEVDGAEPGRLELATDMGRTLGEEVGLRPLRVGPDEGVVVRLP
jgi:alpha-glucosidase